MLVDQTPEQLLSLDPVGVDVRHGVGRPWWAKLAGTTRPSTVVMPDVPVAPWATAEPARREQPGRPSTGEVSSYFCAAQQPHGVTPATRRPSTPRNGQATPADLPAGGRSGRADAAPWLPIMPCPSNLPAAAGQIRGPASGTPHPRSVLLPLLGARRPRRAAGLGYQHVPDGSPTVGSCICPGFPRHEDRRAWSRPCGSHAHPRTDRGGRRSRPRLLLTPSVGFLVAVQRTQRRLEHGHRGQRRPATQQNPKRSAEQSAPEPNNRTSASSPPSSSSPTQPDASPARTPPTRRG